MVTEDHDAMLSLEKAGRFGERPKHGVPDATKSVDISFKQRPRQGQRTQHVKRFGGTTRASGGPCQSPYFRGFYESDSAIFSYCLSFMGPCFLYVFCNSRLGAYISWYHIWGSLG